MPKSLDSAPWPVDRPLDVAPAGGEQPEPAREQQPRQDVVFGLLLQLGGDRELVRLRSHRHTLSPCCVALVFWGEATQTMVSFARDEPMPAHAADGEGAGAAAHPCAKEFVVRRRGPEAAAEHD